MHDPQPSYRACWNVESHADGRVTAESHTTELSDTRPTVLVLPARNVVPIIFVPGIMGSNLKARADILGSGREKNRIVVHKNAPVWRVNCKACLLAWLSRSPAERQLRLRAEVLEVDHRGAIPQNIFMFLFCSGATPMARTSVALARSRGWGSVSNAFYGPFLDWLDFHLNAPAADPMAGGADNAALQHLKASFAGHLPMGTVESDALRPLAPEEFDLLKGVHTPVHAFGYNWLNSNRDSGARLAAYIEQVISSYRTDSHDCDQVILVTHSMGGLVARAACTVHGASGQVLGVFHGDMPTDGAAAAYKRMVAGFGGEGEGFNPVRWLSGHVLGADGHATTPTLALNAGPLELLPNARYRDGQPWLTVRDAEGKVLEQRPRRGDPCTEIYQQDHAWWRPCQQAWLNPAGIPGDVDPFTRFATLAEHARDFHADLRDGGDFHPNTHAHYGIGTKTPAYGEITWTLDAALQPEQHAALQRANLDAADMRIHLSAGDLDVRATLSQPEAHGDGTVPAADSARAVERGVPAGNLLVRDTGYSHDAGFDPGGPSNGAESALLAIVRMLGAQVARAAPRGT